MVMVLGETFLNNKIGYFALAVQNILSILKP